jgi:hypothetical protein
MYSLLDLYFPSFLLDLFCVVVGLMNGKNIFMIVCIFEDNAFHFQHKTITLHDK